jgi:hypothetical protein
MRFIEELKGMLLNNGLADSQAQDILEKFVAQAENDTKKVLSSSKDKGDYPLMVYSLVWVDVKRFVLLWARDNCPMAWWLPVFDSEG